MIMVPAMVTVPALLVDIYVRGHGTTQQVTKCGCVCARAQGHGTTKQVTKCMFVHAPVGGGEEGGKGKGKKRKKVALPINLTPNTET